MSLTPSKMVPLASEAPDFCLVEPLSGKMRSLADVKGQKATVVMFICNHCPFVKHVQEGLVRTANHYQSQGVGFVAINSNDVDHYPEDSPENMVTEAQKHAYPFPYLFDEDQHVARAYQATCTPDFFVFDADLKCVYRGRYDESTPGNGLPASGEALHSALDAVLKQEKPDALQYPSVGCNIKWKSS